MTIYELCSAHLAATGQVNSKTGRISYECHSRLFCSLWGERKAATLTRAEIEGWARDRKQVRAAGTVRHEVAFLKAAYNRAMDNGQVVSNPCARLKIHLKCPGRHQRITEVQEMDLRKKYAEMFAAGELLWLVERFAILTGLRQGEQLWLEPKHLQGDYLQIPEQGKTGARTIPLHPEALAIAELWADISADYGSPYIFWPPMTPGLDRRRASQQHTRKVWAPVTKALGLRYQRRDLRRTFASRLAAKGVSIYEVQTLLGHATTKQTETYCKLEMSKLRASVLLL